MNTNLINSLIIIDWSNNMKYNLILVAAMLQCIVTSVHAQKSAPRKKKILTPQVNMGITDPLNDPRKDISLTNEHSRLEELER